MPESQIVSLPVSSGVSSPNAEIISAKTATKRRPRSSPGLYLIKTGSAYIFQMRLPKKVAGGCKPLVRLGIGVIPKREARRIADLLAAIAREKFERIEKAMDDGEFWPLMEEMLGGDVGDMDDDDRGKRAWLAVTMSLKSALYDIRYPAPLPTPEEEGDLALMRGLVKIAQEKSRKDAGLEYDQEVGDHAELLAKRLIEKHESKPVGSSGPSFKSTQRRSGPITLREGSTDTGQLAEVDKDRRFVERQQSDKPLFSQAADVYLQGRITKKGKVNKDIETAQTRLNIFIELIGDHPLDTYSPTDLQAFINLMAFWPPNEKDRPADMPAHDIINSNRDRSKGVLALQTLRNGYIGVIKPVFRKGATEFECRNPIQGGMLTYPDMARRPVSAEPIAATKIETLFKAGAKSRYIDDVMLPLLGLLTGRRLGLLIHLTGSDIREKFDGVWVAEPNNVVNVGGTWTRVPIKTEESGRYFVLHNFLVEIGYVEWLRKQGDNFAFPQLMKLADPSRSASSYMRRLYDRAGIKGSAGERFHSLRNIFIGETREMEEVGGRERRMQAGHAIGGDEHDQYGWKTLTEKQARIIAKLPLNPEIDFSMFHGLDFDRLAKARRRPDEECL